jgi:hypothetical protein
MSPSNDRQPGHPDAASFYPLNVPNTWTYTVEHSASKASILTWKITQKDTLDGNVTFHLWAQPSALDEPLDLCSDENGVFECGSDRYLLRNPVKLGERWLGHLKRVGANPAAEQFEITSESENCRVGKHHFDLCVQVQEIDKFNHVVSLTTYANSIGPVEYVYRDTDAKKPETILRISKWRLSPTTFGDRHYNE